MQGLPIKVKNVTIHTYFNPNEPLQQKDITGATGTYTVGTLTTNVFYNLDLNADGKRINPLKVHGKYFATGEDDNGNNFTTPWMYCLNNSDSPDFGRTINHFPPKGENQPEAALPASVDPSEYIKLTALTDISVSQLFPAPAIGQTLLIENGKGNVIGTRLGTPHLMGVEVASGNRVGKLNAGMKYIMITGKTSDGKYFSQVNLTTISAGEPAIFLQEFFTKG